MHVLIIREVSLDRGSTYYVAFYINGGKIDGVYTMH